MQEYQQAQQEYFDRQRQWSSAWRFAQYDRVRCFLGGDVGWAAGNVQAINEPAPDGSGETLPYVVMLDPPLKRLISVPVDADHCVRPDACYAAGPVGGECAEAVARAASASAQARAGSSLSKALRFDVGGRVACLTAGPDGTGWPRQV